MSNIKAGASWFFPEMFVRPSPKLATTGNFAGFFLARTGGSGDVGELLAELFDCGFGGGVPLVRGSGGGGVDIFPGVKFV